MSLDSIIGKFRNKGPKQEGQADQIEKLELLRQEITAHQEAGNGTIDDSRRFGELTTTLEGLRKKMEERKAA